MLLSQIGGYMYVCLPAIKYGIESNKDKTNNDFLVTAGQTAVVYVMELTK